MPIKLGELLVKDNLITPQQLQESLQYQKQHGGKLGYNLAHWQKLFPILGWTQCVVPLRQRSGSFEVEYCHRWV